MLALARFGRFGPGTPFAGRDAPLQRQCRVLVPGDAPVLPCGDG